MIRLRDTVFRKWFEGATLEFDQDVSEKDVQVDLFFTTSTGNPVKSLTIDDGLQLLSSSKVQIMPFFATLRIGKYIVQINLLEGGERKIIEDGLLMILPYEKAAIQDDSFIVGPAVIDGGEYGEDESVSETIGGGVINDIENGGLVQQ